MGERRNAPAFRRSLEEPQVRPLEENLKLRDDAQAKRPDPKQRRDRFAMDLPREFQEKAVSLAKLRIDLEYTMERTPLDRAKAMELYGQIRKLEQEIAMARFEKKLDRIEAEAKKREERRMEKQAEAKAKKREEHRAEEQPEAKSASHEPVNGDKPTKPKK